MAKKLELMEKAFDLAVKYEREYGGCSQCVLGSIKNTIGNITDEVFKAGTGLAGGVALTGQACGACTGGVMAISAFIGREYENFNDQEGVRFNTFKVSEKLVNRFKEEYGSINCWDIQKQIMGKSYDLRNKDDYQAYLGNGGHDDKCPIVCGNASKWVIEILFEEGVLK